jgi:hypothetical protein
MGGDGMCFNSPQDRMSFVIIVPFKNCGIFIFNPSYQGKTGRN